MRQTSQFLQQCCATSILLLVGGCTTMSDQERKEFLCEEWGRGTKNIAQLKATYSIATGDQLRIRSGGPRTGISYIEGDLKQLVEEVDTACSVESSI